MRSGIKSTSPSKTSIPLYTVRTSRLLPLHHDHLLSRHFPFAYGCVGVFEEILTWRAVAIDVVDMLWGGTGEDFVGVESVIWQVWGSVRLQVLSARHSCSSNVLKAVRFGGKRPRVSEPPYCYQVDVIRLFDTIWIG